MSSADAGGVWGTLWDNLDRLVMKMLAKMIRRELCYRVSHENMENDNLHMSHLLLLGKFEYTGGPIFKVVLEC